MKSLAIQLSLSRENSTYNFGVGMINGRQNELSLNLNELHPNELTKLNSFQHDRRKESYLLGRLSAKKAIQALSEDQSSQDIFIDSGVFGFPVVKSPMLRNMQVSITHCGELGLSIAFPEDHPMGIDLEEINPTALKALITQLTKHEIEISKNLPLSEETGFTLIWTIKEALSKILKTGLMTNFNLFEIDQLMKNGTIWESTFSHCGQYKSISYIHKNTVCSLVLPKNSEFEVLELIKLFEEIE